MMINKLLTFYDAIRAAGLEPPENIVPGKLYRFPGAGKCKSNRAGWCILFADGQGGCFGDWSSGVTEYWHANQNKLFSPSEKSEFKRQASKARTLAKEEKKKRQYRAAQRASKIWNASIPVPVNHPYIIRKDINPYGARLHKDFIVVSVMDFTGKQTSLQFISSGGDKKLLTDGRKQGCFIHVSGDMSNPSQVIICEGWATGCSLAFNASSLLMAEVNTSVLVLAAIDAGNLKSVAMSAHHRWPSAKLVIAGDDDRQTEGNPGATKAKEAAIASGALLALPQWETGCPITLTDFNDLDTYLNDKAAWLEKERL